MRKLFTLLSALAITCSINAQTSVSGIINHYSKVTAIDPCLNTIYVESTVDLAVGDKVLLIQMQGATIDLSNSINFGNILSHNDAGNYEFGIIESKTAISITLQNTILRTYDATGSVQVVRVPVYGDVDVDGILTAQEWNGNTGGILVFEADNVDLNANIDVSGKGFRGGKSINYPESCPSGLGSSVYFTDTLSGKGGRKGEGIAKLSGTYIAGRGKAANGGGGGNDHNGGAGGGSLASAAGIGGENDESVFSCPGSPGFAAVAIDNTALSNKLFLGGGGGSGHGNNTNGTDGGNGGGIIFIRANNIVGVDDTIKSNGSLVSELAWGDGAGGGGAGGSVFLDVNNVNDVDFQTLGGKGGDTGAPQCTGPGGGGSGGVMKFIPSITFTGCSWSAPGAAPGTNITIGSDCLGLTNGATSGTSGLIVYTLSVPESILPFTTDFADAGGDIAVCSGTSVTLNASGGIIYLWTPSTYLSDNSIANPVCTPIADISYIVSVTNANGCTDADILIVDVLPGAMADAGSDVDVCAGESVNLNASGGVEYEWSPVLFLDDPNISNPESTPTSDISYTVTVTDANGCVGTDMISVTVNPSEFLTASDDASICLGSSTTLNASGGISYLWSPDIYLDDATSSSPTTTPLTDITYTVTSISADGCTDAEIINVTLTDEDFLELSADEEVCTGESIILHATGGTEYLWSPTTYLDDPTSSDPVATPLADIIYTVTAINGGGCSDEQTITISVLPVEFAVVNPDALVCSGTATELFATGGTDYLWSPSTYLDDATSSTPTCTPLTDITYYVSVTSADGCLDIDTVNIILLPEVVVEAGPDTSICSGGQFKLFANGGISYEWTPTTNLDNPFISNPTCNPVSSVDYIVFVTDINGCVGTDTVEVIVNAPPTIFAGDDLIICRGDTITLTADGGVNYIWEPETLTACGICSSADFAPVTTTTYVVQGFDINGCMDIDEVTVTVDICNSILEKLSELINVYPNPATDKIFIQCPDAVNIENIQLMNLLGEIIISETILNNKLIEVRFNNIPTQQILVRVYTDKGIINKMILIE